MDGYSIFLLGFGKAFILDATIQPPPASGATAARMAPDPAKPQAGFARLSALLAILAAFAIVSCAGLEPARTPEEKLVYVVATHDGLVQSVDLAVLNKTITPQQGRQAFNALNSAKSVLDGARVAINGCVDPATKKSVEQVPGVQQLSKDANGAPLLILQTLQCRQSGPLDQVIQVSSALAQLAAYYQLKQGAN
jgi:hypothetical protein